MENASEKSNMGTTILPELSPAMTFNLTVASFQSGKNNSNTTTPPTEVFFPCNNPDNLIDEATAEQAEKVFFIIVLPSIEVFGIVTNVVNLIVFERQGLKDRINLCLFSLAMADLSFLVLMFSGKFFCFLGLFDEGLEEYWSKKHFETVLGPIIGTLNISNLMTMVISIERCICVVSPFTAKKFLKTRYMAVVIVIMAVYILGIYSLLNLKYNTELLSDPATNASRWTSRLSDFYLRNSIIIDILYNHLLSLAVPCVSLAVVIVATSITVSKLRKTMSWRHQSVQGYISAGDKREAAVTKMLTVVCLIYVSTMTPSLTQVFFRTLVPGYLPIGKYCNLFTILQPTANVFEVTNSSVNFIVYFTMGSKFRDTLRQLFGTWREKKESFSQSLPSVSRDLSRHVI